MAKKQEKRISLINHEGDCLWAMRSDDGGVVVYDQWEDIVDIMSIPDFCSWIDGETGLRDSSGKTWYWNDESRDAKPGIYRVFNFLK